MCRLQGFFTQYRGQSRTDERSQFLAPVVVTQAPPGSFGGSGPGLPQSIGELMRSIINSSAAEALPDCDVLASDARKQQLKDLFWSRLEWRLECAVCGKFSLAVLTDPVLRVWVGRQQDTLAAHLQRFLSERSCSCGQLLTGLRPSRTALPEFLVLELDRRVMNGTEGTDAVGTVPAPLYQKSH